MFSSIAFSMGLGLNQGVKPWCSSRRYKRAERLPCPGVSVLEDVLGFPGGTSGKEPAYQCRRCKRCGFDPLGQGNPLEEGMATHSSILARRIPWTGEPGGLWPMVLQRVEQY